METVKTLAWELSGYSLPRTLRALAAGVNAALLNLPADVDPVIEDSSDGYWFIEAFYERPETDKERRKREAIERRYRAEREDAERALYENLKAKYGDESSQESPK